MTNVSAAKGLFPAAGGIRFLQDVWGMIILLAGIAAAALALYRLWKHRKDTKL